MAKKEYIKITPEGLNMLTIFTYSNLAEMNGFYGKDVFFTEKFAGDVQYLYQALGNLGAYVREKDFDKDIEVVVISNHIIESVYSESHLKFISEFEDRLNQNNSPYRRVKFISENHLIWYLENRIKNTNDDLLDELVKKYKKSCKGEIQQNLF
ncbi:MAG: hypothetical protein VB048_06315 [Bacteroidaceae bacterium]|nr:hypothetical protein [Bacteroidaceae bacterium]MEA4975730.1 hypothetical protein [Paludibacter sp.]